ncbi:cell division protein FtsQ [Caloramator fervidus]|uniref:Cell division protein FtsQ n=1 Tax=Caloramator fervidus TaxID=29344 RepID=A0A1H5URS3_9CLOT|nr:FtsQ-type POTRA domain-containing protein [Caloramator fervidus]SEF77785.1 cell division protein FtsQ [Caloramator fervidus]
MEKKNNKKARMFIFLVFVFLLFFLLTRSSYFNIKVINVQGNYLVSKDEIIVLSELYNKNIFLISLEKVKERIKNNPYIEDVVIKRNIPSSVTLIIKEKKIRGIIKLDNLFISIDDKGRMIQELDSFPTDKIFVIEGIKIKEYVPNEYVTNDEKILKSLIEVLKISDYTKELGIVSVNLSNIDNITFKTNKGIDIDVGDCSNLDYKLAYAKSILKSDILKNQKGIIQVRSSGVAVFKRR